MSYIFTLIFNPKTTQSTSPFSQKTKTSQCTFYLIFDVKNYGFLIAFTTPKHSQNPPQGF
jgi:hypothetical protein